MSASSSRPKVNLRSTAVKRIMQEASELSTPQEDDFTAAPLESDIFEWHCTMRGVEGSEYEGGLYHLRIVLPPSYPMSAPDIILMTPNGRFELGKKICIDGLTSFHAGSWQPAWGVRTAILGLRSFWMQGGEALSAIGALDYPKEERKRLAKLSRDWVCPTCGVRNHEQIPEKESHTSTTTSSSSSTVIAEANTSPHYTNKDPSPILQLPSDSDSTPKSPTSPINEKDKDDPTPHRPSLLHTHSTETQRDTSAPAVLSNNLPPRPESASRPIPAPTPTTQLPIPIPIPIRIPVNQLQLPSTLKYLDALIMVGFCLFLMLLARKFGIEV